MRKTFPWTSFRLSQWRLRAAIAAPLLAITFFIGAGCADDPSAVGIGILPPSDLPVFFVDTLYPASFSSSYTKISTANEDIFVPTWVPSTLLLGQRQTLVAGTYVRFTEFPDSLRGITITSADLVLYTKSIYGDSTSLTLGQYSVFRGRGTWVGDSLTYDSLDMFPGTYADITPAPVASGTVRVDTGTVSLPIDTALVREWFTVTIDTSTNNQGLFLTAQPMNTIWGFWSFAHPSTQFYPMLRIEYTKNGIPGSYTHQKGFSRYLAKLPASDLLQDPSRMYVQTGVAYRTQLRYDLSSLPIPISINRAKLVLSLDSLASDISSYSPDSLVIFGERTTGSIDQSTAGLGIPLPEPGRRVYDFNTDRIIRYWQNPGIQSTVVIAGLGENNSLARFVFYGPAAPDPLKPMMIITYSKVLKTGESGGNAR